MYGVLPGDHQDGAVSCGLQLLAVKVYKTGQDGTRSETKNMLCVELMFNDRSSSTADIAVSQDRLRLEWLLYAAPILSL